LKPKRTFLSVVTVISILGVMLGVAVLIIVLSVMSGFDEMWRDKILSFNAHITVTGYGIIEDEENVARKIASIDKVTGVAPFVQGLVFVQFRDRVYTPMVRGVDPIREITVSKIPANMVAGQYSVEGDDVVIGKDLAARLGVSLGDKLLVYSPQNFTNPDEVHLPDELTVAGISTPALAGEWIFALTDDARLLAIARNTGRVRWISQLAQWRDPEDREGPIFWTGPVLAGNRLWIASSEGEVRAVDVVTGTSSPFTELSAGVSLPPVVAGGTMYILDDSGKITAWR
jgi:hypothetical protein